MGESVYSSQDELENAARHRAAQKVRADKAAKRRSNKAKARAFKPSKPKRKHSAAKQSKPRDSFGRPIYRPGMGKEFYDTSAWQHLRYTVLKRFGAKCMCCGATRSDGIKIHIDHIRPRSKFPLLELVESNLQVLCEPCNVGKGSWDQTDWRDGAGITHPRLTAIKAAHG